MNDKIDKLRKMRLFLFLVCSPLLLGFIGPNTAIAETIYITDTGWSLPVGTWDDITRIATLTQDLTDDIIVITVNDINLNGGGHSMTGSGTEIPDHYGITAIAKSNLTITNITVQNFEMGIHVRACGNVAIQNVTAQQNNWGMFIENVNNSSLTDNTANNNQGHGIEARLVWNSSFTGNRTDYNGSSGLYIPCEAGYGENAVVNNDAHNNGLNGIHLQNSHGHVVENNRATGNGHTG